MRNSLILPQNLLLIDLAIDLQDLLLLDELLVHKGQLLQILFEAIHLFLDGTVVVL
jgi:hypothetical protein